MNQDRRQIIVKEIEHWRRSKLLPEQYCDFLMNLYADPEMLQSMQQSSVSKAISAISRATGVQWLLTFGTFTLISFVVLYFNEFHPVMQIAVVIFGTGVFLWLGKRVRSRNEATGLSLTMIGMLLLLSVGIYILHIHELDQRGFVTGLLALCAVFWMIYGMVYRFTILHFCGWLAAILVYTSLLSQMITDSKWYEIQLYWLPIACLLGWSAWFVHRFRKDIAGVLFLTSMIVWFMPELFSIMTADEMLWLQLQILVKIAIGGMFLFTMRKKWMVWVL